MSRRPPLFADPETERLWRKLCALVSGSARQDGECPEDIAISYSAEACRSQRWSVGPGGASLHCDYGPTLKAALERACESADYIVDEEEGP